MSIGTVAGMLLMTGSSDSLSLVVDARSISSFVDCSDRSSSSELELFASSGKRMSFSVLQVIIADFCCRVGFLGEVQETFGYGFKRNNIFSSLDVDKELICASLEDGDEQLCLSVTEEGKKTIFCKHMRIKRKNARCLEGGCNIF